MEKLTRAELFQRYAPAFNFELNAYEIVQELYAEGILLPIAGKDDLYSLVTHVPEYYGE